MSQTQTVPEQQPERTLKQWATPLLLMFVLVFGPWIAAAIVGESRAAIPALVIMAVAPLALGFIDARSFRLSWTFIINALIANFVASMLFYNDGALIYTIGVGFLAWLGSKLGEATKPKSTSATGSEA